VLGGLSILPALSGCEEARAEMIQAAQVRRGLQGGPMISFYSSPHLINPCPLGEARMFGEGWPEIGNPPDLGAPL
jgi:hypothetical protein